MNKILSHIYCCISFIKREQCNMPMFLLHFYVLLAMSLSSGYQILGTCQ